MAEEQRICFTLVDNSGQSTGTASAPSPQGTSIPPGSQVAQEFQQQVSQGGADRVVGRGSATARDSHAYSTSQTPSSAFSGDPLLAATRQIFATSPKTTADELQQALGIEATRAQQLVAQAINAGPAGGYSVDDLISGVGPVYSYRNTESLISGVREGMASEAQDRANTTRQRESELNRRIQELGNIEPYSPFGSSYDPFHVENRAVGPGDLDAASRMVQSARSLNAQPSEAGTTQPPNLSGLNTLMFTGSAIANQFGGPGRVASTAINALGAFANTEAGVGALAGMAPGLAAAGPYAAAGLAAAAIPIAAGYAVLNEAERARAIVGDYSPEAAQANAVASVRQIMADLSTANRLGDEAADYTTARSRLNAASQGARDLISEPILQNFNKSLDGLATVVERLNAFFENNPTATKILQGQVESSFELAKRQFGPVGFWDFLDYMAAQKEEQAKANSPFTWFQVQPHLEPPAPFSGMGKGGTPAGTRFNPVAGLSF